MTRAVELIEKAARALHVAHEAKLIHRDIKPGNIMVTPDGEPVILDFGLARDVESDVGGLTLSGDLLGTPAYMSPEQLLAQRVPLDRRTDIYSLGVTLYEYLSLERPFDAPTRADVYQKILTSDPPDPRRINPHISRDLKVVLETALEKDRNRRYQTAQDFAEDLRRVRSYEPIHARPAGPILRFRRWTQRNPVLATATLGLFLVLATGLGISLGLLARVRREKAAREVALRDREVALAERGEALQKAREALGLARREGEEKARALGEREKALQKARDALDLARREGEAKARALSEKEVLARDKSRPEPYRRLAECLRAAGEPARARKAIEDAVGAGIAGNAALWNLWFQAIVLDLKRSPAEALAALPPQAREAEEGYAADLRWLLERLAGGEPIRIDAGGDAYRSEGDVAWGRDRFFRGGFRYSGEYRGRPFEGEIAATDDDPLYRTERWFPRPPSGRPGYRIPLPAGRYRVTLHFAEIAFKQPGRRIFHVDLEGERKLEGYEPFQAGFATPSARAFDVDVRDGFLDIEFGHRVENPQISALQVEALSS